MIKDAAALFRLDRRRYPRHLAELLERRGKGPYLESDQDLQGFSLVEHQGETWIACEIEDVHPRLPNSLCLLKRLR